METLLRLIALAGIASALACVYMMFAEPQRFVPFLLFGLFCGIAGAMAWNGARKEAARR